MLEDLSSDEEVPIEKAVAEDDGGGIDGEQKFNALAGGESMMLTKSQSQMPLDAALVTSQTSKVKVKKEKKKLHPEEVELQDAIRHRWYIIKRSSKFREYWDYIVMILAIWNCVWTPLTISFDWA